MKRVRRRVTPRKPWAFALVAVLGSCCLALVAGEIVVRALGHRPFRPANIGIRVEPGGRYQTGDPVLGYKHLPGTFRITFPDGHSWTTTHLEDTLRITRPLDTYGQPSGKEQIWLSGCSFVHGWGLDDYQTFAWQLQRLLPAYEIVNFGVGGYGTWQSLLQYLEAVKERTAPRWVVLAYADFHDQRNTRTRTWRRATFEYDRFGTTAQPYVRLDGDGRLVEHFDRGAYREFFLLRHSALANFIDLALGTLEENSLRSAEVTRRIVDRFAAAAREHGSGFALVGITARPKTRSMVAYARAREIPAIDISVDLTRPENRIAFDGHPNAVANRVYARRLDRLLRSLPGADRVGGRDPRTGREETVAGDDPPSAR